MTLMQNGCSCFLGFLLGMYANKICTVTRNNPISNLNIESPSNTDMYLNNRTIIAEAVITDEPNIQSNNITIAQRIE